MSIASSSSGTTHRVAWWLASMGGVGVLPAPGTAASAVAVLPGAWLALHSQSALLIGAVVACLVGLWAIPRAGGTDDPGWVVIDELAGQWVCLAGLPHITAVGCVMAFLVFRVLDIFKPGPIGWADRQHGAAGVMGDDIIAGILGAILLWLLHAVLPQGLARILGG